MSRQLTDAQKHSIKIERKREERRKRVAVFKKEVGWLAGLALGAAVAVAALGHLLVESVDHFWFLSDHSPNAGACARHSYKPGWMLEKTLKT